MEFYINELSLHGQYTNGHDAVAALTTYNRLLSLLHDKQTEGFYNRDLLFHFDRKTLQNETFQVSLDRNPQVGGRFRELLRERLKAKDWRDSRIHADDVFYYHGDDLVTDTTLAEIAERNAQNSEKPRLLLNFSASVFGAKTVLTIVKNQKTHLSVDCADEEKTVNNWIEIWLQKPAPKRRDAFLVDNPQRFQKTIYTVKGATVYIETATNYRWYIDTFHDTNPHFEVFNDKKEHLGIANTETGEIDFSKAEPEKKGKISI